jgi:diguanylate cyclase (GGDEF)-like protein/PAS domain S-box-containing protein
MEEFLKEHIHLQDDIERLDAYHDFIGSMDIAMWHLDMTKGVLTPYFGLEKLLGYQDVTQLISNEFWKNQWHPDDKDLILKRIHACFEDKKTDFDIMHRIRHQSGNYLWFYTKIKIEYHEGKQPSFIAISINIDKLYDKRQNLIIEKETYSTFLKATQAATWIWNVQTHETIFDERWAQMLGYSLEELSPVGLVTWENLVHPDDLDFAYKQINQAFLNPSFYYVAEYRMKHKDGYDVWISDRGQVISWTDDHKPLQMVGIHLDISEMKHLELEMRQREKHYRYLIDSSYDIIYTLDVEGNITFTSSAWQRILGHDIEETKKHTYRDFIHPTDDKRLDSFFSHIYQNQEAFEITELRLRDHKNQYKWFNTSASPMTDDYDHVIGFVGTLRDITQHKELENQLSVERDLFKKTLLSVSDAVISTDHQGNIAVINSNAVKLIGVLENDVKHQPLWSVLNIYFEDEEDMHEKILKTKKEIFISHATLLNQKGKRLDIEMSISPIRDQGKKQEGIAIVFRDVSDKLKKQKEIEFLSYHDYLTGLYNRRYMDQAIQDLDKDRYLPLGFMVFDVNNLKEMNDEYGHQAGDDLLKKVCRLIESSIESKDILGRMGGDEFLLLLPNTTDDDVYVLKHKLINVFNQEEFRSIKLSVALGYAIKTNADDDVYHIMKVADDFMYYHKRSKNV